MGLFSKIINYIQGVNYSSKEDKLSKRINTLNRQVRDLRKVETIDKFDYTAFDISIGKEKVNVEIFNPKEIPTLTSLIELQEQRVKLEKERIQRLTSELASKVDHARNMIESRQAKGAEHLLIQASSICNELKDKHMSNLIAEMYRLLNTLKVELQEEEIERQKEAERKRHLQEAKLREQQQIQKIKEEEAKQKRLQEAREYEAKLAQEEETKRVKLALLKESVTRKKENASAFIQYLKSSGVRYFYHFTDKRNVQSIKTNGGLFSWYYCDKNGINIPNAGGDSSSRGLDMRHQLEDYVRLSFCTDHPMAYRKHKEGATLVLLRVSIEVAAFIDTQFSDKNAAANDHSHGRTLDDLKAVNISATKQTFVSRDSPIFHEHQAECMVKTFIPIEFIENINNPQQMYFS